MKTSNKKCIIYYLIFWMVSVLWFWLGGKSDAFVYSLSILYLVLPISTLLCSLAIGMNSGPAIYKWLSPLFFGAMYLLAAYTTFDLANTLATGRLHIPEIPQSLPGVVCSAVGVIAGTMIGCIAKAHSKK